MKLFKGVWILGNRICPKQEFPLQNLNNNRGLLTVIRHYSKSFAWIILSVTLLHCLLLFCPFVNMNTQLSQNHHTKNFLVVLQKRKIIWKDVLHSGAEAWSPFTWFPNSVVSFLSLWQSTWDNKLQRGKVYSSRGCSPWLLGSWACGKASRTSWWKHIGEKAAHLMAVFRKQRQWGRKKGFGIPVSFSRAHCPKT